MALSTYARKLFKYLKIWKETGKEYSDTHPATSIRGAEFAAALSNLVTQEATLPVITIGTPTTTTVPFSWTAAGYTNFNVSKSTSASGPFTVFLANTAATSTTASGLTTATTYYFKVVADDGQGFSVESAVQSATTA